MYRNLSNFDLSMSHKVKCDSVIGLPIYGFLVVSNSNIWPNSTPLQNIRLQNLSDLDFELSRSLKVKCGGVIGLSIYGFLLIYTVTTRLISLALIATRIIRQNYEKSQMHQMTPKWPWTLQDQRYTTYVLLVPASPIFHSVSLTTIARFPDNSGFWFVHRVQRRIWNFREKIVTNRKLKI